MSDYISREDAKRAACTVCGYCMAEYTNYKTCPEIQRVFERILTADVREVRRGRWIIDETVHNIYGGTYIECSNCHSKCMVQDIDDELFCRTCGADMREQEAKK